MRFSSSEFTTLHQCLVMLDHAFVYDIQNPVTSKIKLFQDPTRFRELRNEAAEVLARTTPQGYHNPDDSYLPILKLALLQWRRRLAAEIEEQKTKTANPAVIQSMEDQLRPLDDMIKQDWVSRTPSMLMPQLTDFVTVQQAEDLLGGDNQLRPRQYDEKFHILQSANFVSSRPPLLSPEVRDAEDRRGSRLHRYRQLQTL